MKSSSETGRLYVIIAAVLVILVIAWASGLHRILGRLFSYGGAIDVGE